RRTPTISRSSLKKRARKSRSNKVVAHCGQLAASAAGLFRFSGSVTEAAEKPACGGFSMSSDATAEGRFGRVAGFPAAVRQRLVEASHQAQGCSLRKPVDERRATLWTPVGVAARGESMSRRQMSR